MWLIESLSHREEWNGRVNESSLWLDAARLRQDLGDILQQDESIWLKDPLAALRWLSA